MDMHDFIPMQYDAFFPVQFDIRTLFHSLEFMNQCSYINLILLVSYNSYNFIKIKLRVMVQLYCCSKVLGSGKIFKSDWLLMYNLTS